jgi:hypothetical protein
MYTDDMILDVESGLVGSASIAVNRGWWGPHPSQ